MSKINLSIGAKIFYNNIQASIVNQIDFQKVLIELSTTKERLVVNIDQITARQDTSAPTVYTEAFTDKQWEIAKHRFEIIKPLLIQNTTKQQVIEIAKLHNINEITLYRWTKSYKDTGMLSSLIPKYCERGGKDKTRLNSDTELIIDSTISELYLHKQKLTPRQIYFEIKKRCKNANLEAPHENTIRNRINQIPAKNLVKTRDGSRKAQKMFTNVDGKFMSGKYPLDIIQIDHTPIDLIVVDEQYRQPIGRPYLTLAIDVYSRMVAGFFISLESPSYFSVSQCLTQAILTKDRILRDYGINGQWNIWGIPRAIHMDNGADFRSIDLQKACEQYSISIEWRPVARPQFGGHIERLIGSSMKAVHVIPGTTFSNITQRGSYNSNKEAVMTLHELEHWFLEYFTNVYHKKIHSSLKMTPEKCFEIGIFGDEHTIGKGLPEKIENENSFKISLLPTIERTIQKHGVIVDKINYYHDVLRKYINIDIHKGNMKKYIFKIDPRDISQIWFFDPAIKDYFAVPYKNMTYPAISRWELKAAQQYLAEKNITDYDENKIFIAHEKLQQIVQNASSQTKTTRRKIESKKTQERQKKQNTISTKPSLHQKPANENKNIFDDIFDDIKPFNEIEVLNNE